MYARTDNTCGLTQHFVTFEFGAEAARPAGRSGAASVSAAASTFAGFRRERTGIPAPEGLEVAGGGGGFKVGD